jgi:aminoglycoside phosphotransferase
MFKYQEKWIRHRSACERLKRERYRFELGVVDYCDLDEQQRQRKFVETIEQIIENEQGDWVKEHGRQDPFPPVLQ